MTPIERLVARPSFSLRAPIARNLAGAIVGGLLIATIEFAATRGTVQFSVLEQISWLMRLSLHWAISALPVGVALWVAEWQAVDGSPAASSYALAVVVGAIAGACVMAGRGKFIDPAISQTAVGFDMTIPDRFLYGLWQLAFWGGVGATLHATDLRHKRSAIALQQGELARLRSERRLGEVQLAAMHAQVEPEFVLSTLHTVERLNAEDVAASDRVLDALIRFLREAIPLLRRPTSTVAHECRLLQMYLDVIGAAYGVAKGATVALDSPARDMVMPPGLLVSLAQQVHGAVSGGRASCAVRVIGQGDHCDIDLSVSAATIDHTPALDSFIARAEQRLKLSGGPESSIRFLHDEPDGFTLRIALINQQGGST